MKTKTILIYVLIADLLLLAGALGSYFELFSGDTMKAISIAFYIAAAVIFLCMIVFSKRKKTSKEIK